MATVLGSSDPPQTSRDQQSESLPDMTSLSSDELTQLLEVKTTALNTTYPLDDARAAAISVLRQQCLQDGELFLQAWFLWSYNEYNLPQERVVMLSNLALSRAKYDFTQQKVMHCTRVAIESIKAILISNEAPIVSLPVTLPSFMKQVQPRHQQTIKLYTRYTDGNENIFDRTVEKLLPAAPGDAEARAAIGNCRMYRPQVPKGMKDDDSASQAYTKAVVQNFGFALSVASELHSRHHGQRFDVKFLQ